MDKARIKDLLPFYVAGTLAEDDRKLVEEALRSSDEFQADLRFWEGTNAAVRAEAAYEAAGHLTPEEIIDYAQGKLPIERRSQAEQHLRSCSECSEECRLVKLSIPAPQPSQPRFLERLTAVRSIRLVYAVPAVAVFVALVVFYFGNNKTAIAPPDVPLSRPVSKPTAVVVPSASLWLTYEPALRSTEKRRITKLVLTDEKEIRVFAAIPHNGVEGIRYVVSLESNGTKRFNMPDTLLRYGSSAANDSLRFVVSRDVLPPPGKQLSIAISEILPKQLRGLTPETYMFSVEMAGSQ